MLAQSPAWRLPVDAEVPDFAYIDVEIPCLDRDVPVPRKLTFAERVKLERAAAAKKREQTRSARKHARAMGQSLQAEERRSRQLPCPFCGHLVYAERPCKNCLRFERERVRREQAVLWRQPVARVEVMVRLPYGGEVALEESVYQQYLAEAVEHRVDLPSWTMVRLGLLTAT